MDEGKRRAEFDEAVLAARVRKRREEELYSRAVFILARGEQVGRGALAGSDEDDVGRLATVAAGLNGIMRAFVATLFDVDEVKLNVDMLAAEAALVRESREEER